jgi:hypothetical protein
MTRKVLIYRNGILLPRGWWDYPRWWYQRLRTWAYNKLGRVYGGIR